jgi:hypothetical protein
VGGCAVAGRTTLVAHDGPRVLGALEPTVMVREAEKATGSWAGRRVLSVSGQHAFGLSFWCGTCPFLFDGWRALTGRCRSRTFRHGSTLASRRSTAMWSAPSPTYSRGASTYPAARDRADPCSSDTRRRLLRRGAGSHLGNGRVLGSARVPTHALLPGRHPGTRQRESAVRVRRSDGAAVLERSGHGCRSCRQTSPIERAHLRGRGSARRSATSRRADPRRASHPLGPFPFPSRRPPQDRGSGSGRRSTAGAQPGVDRQQPRRTHGRGTPRDHLRNSPVTAPMPDPADHEVSKAVS